MARRLLSKVHPVLPSLPLPRFYSTMAEEPTGELATDDDFIVEMNARLASGRGPLRAWTGEDSNKLGRMRWTVGKVKGKLKVEMRPMELVHHDRKTNPWKSRVAPSSKSMSYRLPLKGKNTYKEHASNLEKYLEKNPSMGLGLLCNTNFIHKEFERYEGAMATESVPSLLGVDEAETLVRLRDMKEAGFSEDDALAFVGAFPQWVAVKWDNVYPVVEYLTKELKMGVATVIALMEKHPYMFTQMSDQVIRNLRVYAEDIKLPPKELATLLNHAPSITYAPLLPRLVELLKKVKGHMGNTAMVRMILHCMLMKTLPVTATSNTIRLASILHCYKVEPHTILESYPDFYELEANQLQSIIDYLSSNPLYFSWTVIRDLLSFNIQYIAGFSKKEVEDHVNLLCEILDCNASVYHDLFVGHMLRPRKELVQQMTVLREAGFEPEDLRTLYYLQNSETSLSAEELESKLKFLFGIPGVDVKFLTTYSKYMFRSKSLVEMESRLEFAKKHKPELVSAERMFILFMWSDRMFSKHCKHEYTYPRRRDPVRLQTEQKKKGTWDKSVLRAEACDLRLSSTTLDKMRVPSVMGPSKDECLARLEHLEEVLTQLKIDDNNHYCKRVLYDAVPLALGMNYENAANVLAAQLDWDTLKKHPHLLLQDASEMEKNIETQKKLWGPSAMDVLEKFPLLTYLPILPSVMEKVVEVVEANQLTFGGITHMLTHSMHARISPLPTSPGNILLCAMVHNYKADPATVQRTFPKFYDQDGEKLQEVVSYLQFSKLHLKDYNVRLLLEKWPRILCSIRDQNQLQEHLDYLFSIISPQLLRKRLEDCGELLSPDSEPRAMVEGLKEVGVSLEMVKKIFQTYPELMLCGKVELQVKFRSFLGIPGVDTEVLMKHLEYLFLSISLIQGRLEVARRYKPEMVDVASLNDLFISGNMRFSKLCGVSLFKYQVLTNETYNTIHKRRNFHKVSRRANQRTVADYQELYLWDYQLLENPTPIDLAKLSHTAKEIKFHNIGTVLSIVSGEMDSREWLLLPDHKEGECSDVKQLPEDEDASQSGQIMLEEDVDAAQAECDEMVEEELDSEVVKNLILKLSKAVAKEDAPYWDYCEEEEEVEECLDLEFSI